MTIHIYLWQHLLISFSEKGCNLIVFFDHGDLSVKPHEFARIRNRYKIIWKMTRPIGKICKMFGKVKICEIASSSSHHIKNSIHFLLNCNIFVIPANLSIESNSHWYFIWRNHVHCSPASSLSKKCFL